MLHFWGKLTSITHTNILKYLITYLKEQGWLSKLQDTMNSCGVLEFSITSSFVGEYNDMTSLRSVVLPVFRILSKCSNSKLFSSKFSLSSENKLS